MIPTKVIHSIVCCVAILSSSCNPCHQEYKQTKAHEKLGYNKEKSDAIIHAINYEKPKKFEVTERGNSQHYSITYSDFRLSITHNDFVEYEEKDFWDFHAIRKTSLLMKMEERYSY
jgi:hypothetical protein